MDTHRGQEAAPHANLGCPQGFAQHLADRVENLSRAPSSPPKLPWVSCPL